MITIQDYYKTYRNFAMHISDLTLNNDKIYALIGKNGAGKTTLLSSISGQINYQGSILFDSISIKKNRVQALKLLGYVGDQLFFNRDIKLKNFIDFTRSFYESWDSPLYYALLKSLNLEQYLNKKIKELSKGNLAKANIIVSLSRHPKFLILDEPTSGLDLAVREEVIDAVLKNKGKESTILFSTHIVEDIEEIASDIIIINEGKLLVNESKQNTLFRHNNKSLKDIIKKYISI